MRRSRLGSLVSGSWSAWRSSHTRSVMSCPARGSRRCECSTTPAVFEPALRAGDRAARCFACAASSTAAVCSRSSGCTSSRIERASNSSRVQPNSSCQAGFNNERRPSGVIVASRSPALSNRRCICSSSKTVRVVLRVGGASWGSTDESSRGRSRDVSNAGCIAMLCSRVGGAYLTWRIRPGPRRTEPHLIPMDGFF